MLIFNTLFFISFLLTFVNAQSRCGTTEYEQFLISKDSNLLFAREDFEKNLQKYLQFNKKQVDTLVVPYIELKLKYKTGLKENKAKIISCEAEYEGFKNTVQNKNKVTWPEIDFNKYYLAGFRFEINSPAYGCEDIVVPRFYFFNNTYLFNFNIYHVGTKETMLIFHRWYLVSNKFSLNENYKIDIKKHIYPYYFDNKKDTICNYLKKLK